MTLRRELGGVWGGKRERFPPPCYVEHAILRGSPSDTPVRNSWLRTGNHLYRASYHRMDEILEFPWPSPLKSEVVLRSSTYGTKQTKNRSLFQSTGGIPQLRWHGVRARYCSQLSRIPCLNQHGTARYRRQLQWYDSNLGTTRGPHTKCRPTTELRSIRWRR